ncbi:MAG: hypothetical protein R3D34_09180 [Nitratireductor sp.]
MFGRYATYCGSSPFMAPATLMLVAHVEQDGVWLPEGGIHSLARMMQRKAEQLGVQFRSGQKFASIAAVSEARPAVWFLKTGRPSGRKRSHSTAMPRHSRRWQAGRNLPVSGLVTLSNRSLSAKTCA